MGWREIAIAFVWYFNVFVLFYFLALNTIYLVLFFISLREVFRFVRRTFFSDYGQIMQSEMTWPISILVPAHNEEKTIVETVRSLQMINYGEFEIIVINDGSTDGTLQRLREAYDLGRVDKVYRRSIETEPVRAVYGSLEHPHLLVIDKEKGGKSDALNAGINLSRYPLFCSVDADSIIEDNALLRVVKPFMERRIIATHAVDWPEIPATVASPEMALEDYFTEELTPERVINIMVGDLQRLRVYGQRGLQAPQIIPPEVRDAFDRLTALGFTRHLIAGHPEPAQV